MIVIHRLQEIEVKEEGKESKYFNFNQQFLDGLIMSNKLKFDKTQSTSTLKTYIPKVEAKTPAKVVLKESNDSNLEVFEILKADKIRLKKDAYQDVKKLTVKQAKNLVLFMLSINKKQVTIDILNAFLDA